MLVVADHTLISAVPFLVPALVIVGYLAVHLVRDRRRGDDAGEASSAQWDDDGSIVAWDAEPEDR